jgi:hypothetical protein
MFPLNWKLEGDGNFDFEIEKPHTDIIICYYGNFFSLSNDVEKFVLLTRLILFPGLNFTHATL